MTGVYQTADETITRAQHLEAQGDWLGARSLYDEVLTADPANAKALVGSGNASLHLKEFTVCAERLGKAAALDPDNAPLLRKLAFAQRQCGEIDAAIAAYSRSLELVPDHAGTHNNLGEACFAARRFHDAEVHFKSACDLEPDNVSALFNLANAKKTLADPNAAASLYRRAITLKPDHAGAHLNLGKLLRSQDRNEESIAHFKAVLNADPNYYQAAHELGHALAATEQYDAAITSYRKAVDLAPDKPGPRISLASLLYQTGEIEQARSVYATLAHTVPDDPQLLFALASLAHDLEDHGRSVDLVDRALAMEPDSAALLNLKAVILFSDYDLDRALLCARRAVELAPDFAQAHGTLAAVSLVKDDIAGARRHAEIACKLNADLADAHATLASALTRDGELDIAAQHCATALRLDPQSVQGRIVQAILNIYNGRLLDGWRGYELRLGLRFHKRVESELVLEMPRWHAGDDIDGKNVLLYGEEGVGDQVMQVSCIPDVLDRGANCIVICDPRLVTLFERSFNVSAYSFEQACSRLSVRADVQGCDRVAASMSLCSEFRNRLDDFPRHDGYLVPDPEKVASWKQRYAALGARRTIGISWRGGGRRSTKARRSTDILAWAPILSTSGANFINLQYGDCEDELQRLSSRTGLLLHDWPDADPLTDLDGFAAQVAALDLVISIDNTTVHFAGALGVPCWVLLPNASSWIWMRDGERSPWYPSLRLYRQGRDESWETTIEKVAAALRDLSRGQ